MPITMEECRRRPVDLDNRYDVTHIPRQMLITNDLSPCFQFAVLAALVAVAAASGVGGGSHIGGGGGGGHSHVHVQT